MKELKDIFYFILGSIISTISNRTAQLIIKPVNKAFDYFEERVEEKYIIEKEIKRERYQKIKRYVLYSLGGYENIVFVEKYRNGYKFVFFDLSEVKYDHMKNFDCRVFISEKRDSMILLPKHGTIEIDISYLLE